MARTNKYTSINFNHIYDKPTSNSNPTAAANHPQPPSLSSSSYSAVSRSHGRMLVLTRPSPKPVTAPIAAVPPTQIPDRPRSDLIPDPISLRPLGSTGSPSTIALPGKEVAVTSPKPSKFVPPHLRPGFAGKEERPGPQVGRGIGSPGRFSDDGGRPKSGGGYERTMRRGGESDLAVAGRPGSGGNRPYSSGW